MMECITLEEFYYKELISRKRLLHRIGLKNASLKRAQWYMQRHLAETRGTSLSCADDEEVSGVHLIIEGSLCEESHVDEVFAEEDSQESHSSEGTSSVDVPGDSLATTTRNTVDASSDSFDDPMTLEEFFHVEIVKVTERIHKESQQQQILQENMQQMRQLENSGAITREKKQTFISLEGTLASCSEA